MADLTYSLSIEDQQALRSLKSVQQSVKSVSDGFGQLKAAIAGLAIGAFIQQSFSLASALTNISNSTGIALDAVVGFGQAMAANGGTIDRAVDGLSDLTKNIGEAAAGSSELQKAFSIAGVSLRDLGSLSEQDLLRKTVAGLNQIPDFATRSATAMKLFGESVKGVDLAGLNRDLGGFTADAASSASGIRAAAEAQQNFATALGTVQTQLLAALQPISELALRVSNLIREFSGAIDVVVKLGVAIGSLFAIGKLLALLGAGFASLVTAIAGLKAGAGGLAVTFGSLLTQIRAVWKAKEVTAATVSGLQKRFHYLAIELPIIGKGLSALAVLAGGAWLAMKKLFGSDEQPSENQSAAETKRLQAMNDRIAAQEKLRNVVVAANEQERKVIEQSTRALQTSNSELIKRIDSETRLLGATEETKFAMQTMAEAEQNYLKAIEPLYNKILEIRGKGKNASEAELTLLPTLQAGIQNITSSYESQVPAIQAVISARIEELQAAKNLEIINAALLKQTEDRAAVESSVRDIILNGQERINEAYNQAAQQALPGIYGQLRAIADEENRIAEAAKRRVAEQFGNDTAGLNQAISQIDAASQVIIQRRQEAALAIAQEQSTFTAGWQKAFNDYAATAGSAADQAKNIFSTVTKGMEDAFVNFAKTGKLSVKDLFKSIVETILRSQVQQLLTQTFGSFGGGGGGGFFSNLFAGFFANGGRIPSGKVGVVGEAGPELVTGPATVTPMGGGGGGVTNVTYNINAVDASSFRSLVASDPEFMFAVTEQGRRRIPSSRR